MPLETVEQQFTLYNLFKCGFGTYKFIDLLPPIQINGTFLEFFHKRMWKQNWESIPSRAGKMNKIQYSNFECSFSLNLSNTDGKKRNSKQNKEQLRKN